MNDLCDYCGHTRTWHDDAHGCQHADPQPGGSVRCDCTHHTKPPCDTCAGYGCADCYDQKEA